MTPRHRIVALVLLLGLAALVGAPTPIEAQAKRLVTIASGWVVGVYYPLAGAMSRIVYKAKDLNLRATVESSGASVANAKLIGGGEAEFALLQNDIAYYAHNGTEMFKDQAVKNMGGVFTIYPELIHVVATTTSGIRSPKDLKGKTVAIGPLGSGTEANAVQILEAYGLKLGDLRKAERIGAGEAADALKDGRVDAAFFTVGLGGAVIVDTFVTGKVVLVPVTGTEAEALKKRYPFYTTTPVPANTYKGQEQEVSTVAVMAMMVARSDLPEDLVYRFTKAIFDDLAQFHAAHAAAKTLTLKTALDGMPIPLHAGAEKFYKEKGVK
ncbi:MAG: TAXI family TRAP transporter solute-binding subunit [Candidatus Rokubacteria bacterium]|nr:TAXI family TRAP transporter solute-binding subunit [Candidatus Rokubacteria bacterium]